MRFYTKEATSRLTSVQLKYILVEQKKYTLTITLNRPEKRNAFTPTMAAEIAFALAFGHYEDNIRCIILKANGSVFCAGADLNAFHDPMADAPNPDLPAPEEEILLGDVFRELYKPCIAQVEGPVLAGGFLLICGATFVVCTPASTFGLPEVKRGIWPMQVMASLSRRVPPRKVLEMCITGSNYAADEALAIGLVTHVSEPDKIADSVDKLAAQISANAPYAIKLGMESFEKLAGMPESQQHSFLKKQLEKLLVSEDAKEGTQAFREKRTPVWKGK